jgi:hypothetical protein
LIILITFARSTSYEAPQPKSPSRSEMLAVRPTPKLEDRRLSAVRHCLFIIFAAILHIQMPPPPSATWGRAMPWWQGPT